MKNRWTVLFLLPLFLLPYHTVSAEIFRYVDANGHSRFTDDYNSIPEDQRPGVRVMEETPTGGEIAAKKEKEGPQDEATAVERGFAAEKNDLDKTRKLLNESGQALTKEKEALEKVKAQIIARGNVRKNRAKSKDLREMDRVNKDLVNLSEKIKTHNDKVKALNKKYEAYEAKVKQALGKASE